jgi:hypothetical protein
MLYIHQSSIINHAKSLWLAKKCDFVIARTAIKTFLSSAPQKKSEIDPVLSG